MDSAQERSTIQTYDRTADQWAKSHAIVNDWESEAHQFKELLSSGTILEIGCGGGRDAAELLSLGFDYVGTDASAGMIQTARQEVPGAEFKQLSLYDVASLGQKFDGLWACAVLLHVPKERIDEALQAANQSLRDHAIGMIAIKDGDKEEFEVRDNEGIHEERLFVYWHKDDFAQALNRNGFQVINYTYRPISKRTNWHIYFVEKNREA